MIFVLSGSMARNLAAVLGVLGLQPSGEPEAGDDYLDHVQLEGLRKLGVEIHQY